MLRIGLRRARHTALAATLLRCALASALGLAAARGAAGEPPSAPMLRVETEMHAALVRRLVVDPVHRRLITAGDDKTIRVWQLPQGRLAAVLRFPIGRGYEGRIYALAVTPDGRTIAAGGWTGWEWDRAGAIYLFDAQSGELVRRVGGFPDIIGALSYSRDGRHLAVGLHAGGGLWVLRTADYAVVARDAEYRDKVLGADFDADGRLAVASLDGQLRLYDPRLRLLARKRTQPGAKPLTVRFSPDGTRLAVSFHDVPELAVFRSTDLSLAYTPETKALTHFTRMTDVAWSADGEALYGCGDYSGPGASPILRWRSGGRGPMERLPAARQRIADLQPVPGGGVAFAAEDPAIGVLGTDGRRVLFRGPELADFRGGERVLKVSRDASRVQLSLEHGGAQPARFSLFARELRRGVSEATDLAGPLTQSPHFAIEEWRDRSSPSVNGVRVGLDDYEIARTYAISADHATVVIGTEWALRAYGREAKLKWRTEVPGVVRNLVVAPSGEALVAALSDGTVRWYRMADGGEYLALFPAGEEWIAWTPEGYYVSSNFGDHYVGWHLNRGRERSADFYRAVQFERILYRPDIVDQTFRRLGRPASDTPRRTAPRFDISQLASIAPPRVRVELLDPPLPAADGSARARLRIRAEQTSLPLLEQVVSVNDIPVTPAAARDLSGQERKGFTRDLTVSLAPGENRVRIEVSNGMSLGFAETHVDVAGGAARSPPAGDLYVLAIGVNAFPRLKDADLAYAARDAEALARLFLDGGPHHFRRVFARVVADSADIKPDRVAIVESLQFIAGAGEHDTVIVFLASHGLSDSAGDYFFVPRDARPEDVAAALRGAGGAAPSLIRWTVFSDALRRTAGRRILIADTCHARGVEGRLDFQSLAKRSAASRFSLMVASSGYEESQEHARARHGLFTFALLDGLRGPADADGDGYVTLAEAFRFTLPVVERLRDKSIGPQSPQLVAPARLGETILARRIGSQ